jgi:hypothetical protein
MQWIRSHLSFANVISVIALFVALGGASYAAVSLPKNSVGAKQIKKNGVGASEIKKNAVGASEIKSNAVSGGDVKDGGLTGGDLADGSVGTGDLGNGAVNGSKLADNSVASGKISDGSVALTDLAPEATGPRAYARIDGALTSPADQRIGGADQSRGVDADDIQHNGGAPAAESTGAGVYCFGGLDFTVKSAVVSLDNTDSLPAVPGLTGGTLNFISSVAIFKGEDLGRCDAGHGQARVAIEQVNDAAAPTLANHGFIVWFYG